MKKTFLTATVLLTMVSVLSFANGNSEDQTTETWGPGYGQNGNGTTVERPYEQGDLVTKTGTLKLESDDRPKLVTSDGTYELMYPYMLAYNLEIKDGEEITVKGYDVPAYRWNTDNEKHLRVTEATIDGKVYKLDSDMYGPMGGPRGGGRMGGRMSSSFNKNIGGYGRRR